MLTAEMKLTQDHCHSWPGRVPARDRDESGQWKWSEGQGFAFGSRWTGNAWLQSEAMPLSVCVIATAARTLSRAWSLQSAYVTHTGRQHATWALDVPNDAGKITCRWVKCHSVLTALLMQNLQVCCRLKTFFFLVTMVTVANLAERYIIESKYCD